jgi:hypothetical protein
MENLGESPSKLQWFSLWAVHSKCDHPITIVLLDTCKNYRLASGLRFHKPDAERDGWISPSMLLEPGHDHPQIMLAASGGFNLRQLPGLR